MQQPFQKVKAIVPDPVKLRIWRTYRYGRYLTNFWRMAPNFLIIGEQKCGTTSLYNYLIQHPLVLPAIEKELRYFDRQFDRGEAWYRASFPLEIIGRYYQRKHGRFPITGEASSNYFSHPHAPKRVNQTLPNAKLILLLRNPIERAYSHYQMSVRTGLEKLSFAGALKAENERLSGEVARVTKDENYQSFNYLHYSYLTRGAYAVHLKEWLQFFPRNQFFILNSEEFFTDTANKMAALCEFLDLPKQPEHTYLPLNAGSYSEMDPIIRHKLSHHFEPHNRALYDLIGEDFDW